MWANNLKHLGLTDESTLREYRQAIAAKMQANRLDREMAMKQRLNLTADATQDELQAAIAKWRSDNKELLFAGSRGPKSGKRDAGLGFGMMAGGHGYARGCPAGQSNEASGQQN
jgi:hypothetical protein